MEKHKNISRRELLRIGRMTLYGLVMAGLGKIVYDDIRIGVTESEEYKEFKKELRKLVTELRDSAVELSLSEFDYQPKEGKKALLVQQEENRKNDIEIMEYLLKKYGYTCSTIEPSEANEENILSRIEQIALEGDNYKTVFYYAGHGYSADGGFGIGLDVKKQEYIDESRITPTKLIGSVGKIKGEKAIILDACLSGSFVDYLRKLDFHEMALGKNIIDNFVVIASCPAENISIVSQHFIKGETVGALTMGLYNLLNFTDRSPNLSKAEILCANETYRRNLDKLNDLLMYPETILHGKISFGMQRTSDIDFFL